jgi:hypothetical protein
MALQQVGDEDNPRRGGDVKQTGDTSGPGATRINQYAEVDVDGYQ